MNLWLLKTGFSPNHGPGATHTPPRSRSGRNHAAQRADRKSKLGICARSGYGSYVKPLRGVRTGAISSWARCAGGGGRARGGPAPSAGRALRAWGPRDVRGDVDELRLVVAGRLVEVPVVFQIGRIVLSAGDFAHRRRTRRQVQAFEDAAGHGRVLDGRDETHR